ncbi:MAG TPA: DoxX family membrane protein [Candidatus Sulfotelmatobacter sp.]|jgi:uncharacterized membrane protein YphA (DoxX/SURF4 family)|nr:DoxX family membrane protein [Candidatus Sulfotelmatobacter sp.]
MNQKKLAFLFLRAAIASVFAYAAIASLITPDNWIGFFPIFLRHLIPQQILLGGFSFYEIILAVCLALGKFTFFAAILAALTLSGIIVFNFSQIDIVFRDLAIILSALSLATFTYKK